MGASKESSKNQRLDVSDLSFEEAMARLDETVDALERGGLGLTESANLFEEGLALARKCSELLASAELKISRIQTAYGEQMRLPDEARTYPDQGDC